MHCHCGTNNRAPRTPANQRWDQVFNFMISKTSAASLLMWKHSWMKTENQGYVTLSARETTLSKCVFLCAKCQVEFRHHGARKRDGQCAHKLHLIFFKKCPFKWKLPNCASRCLAQCYDVIKTPCVPKIYHEKITIFVNIWPALILIRCGRNISRKDDYISFLLV